MIVLLALLTTVRAQCQSLNSLSWLHAPKFIDGIHGSIIYNGLNAPRGLRYDGAGHLLVVESQKGVIALSENSAGCSGWTKKVVAEDGTLNHGIAINGTALYASGPGYVYSWTYDPQNLTVSNKQTVVQGLNGSASASFISRTTRIQLNIKAIVQLTTRERLPFSPLKDPRLNTSLSPMARPQI
jgi:hypothetical protein